MAVVPKQNGLDILRKLVPLNTLTEETLAELMESVEFEKVAKGDPIFNAGDANPERVYLLSGMLAIIEAGKEIDSVAAGTNMARYPVAHHIPRRYSVQAKTKAEVVRIDNRLLSELLARGGNALYQVEELNTDSEDDWMSQLLLSPIFQRIPAANIQNIMLRMEEVQVTAGEIVIRQGDEGDYFYLINRGQCSITQEGKGGEISEIAILGAGDSVGEESLLSGKRRGSTVSMMTDGVLFRLGKKDFIEYIKLPLANSISYDAAREKVAKGAVWLDVRAAMEFERGHIPQSKNIPFNELRTKLSGLDSSKTYVVYCQDGLVSSTAVYLLMERDLDGFVLERGLESVPDDVIKKGSVQEGAQIINLRPEQEETRLVPPDSKTAPDDEAGLLRERLQKTEAQAQEQLQRARKMKRVLEQLKGRLAEAEEEGEREGKERRRLLAEIESLQNRLRDRDEAHGALKQKQSVVDERLNELNTERDQLQAELARQYRQVGKLEKRLAGKQQEEDALKRAFTEGSETQQQALAALQAEFDEEVLARSRLDEQNRSLQQALDESSDALAQQQQLSVEAQAELSSQATDNNNLVRQLAVAEKQRGLLDSELDQLRAELEGASTRIAQLELVRNELEKSHQQHKTELESTFKQSLYEAIEGRNQAEHRVLSVTDERDRLAAEVTVLKKSLVSLQQTTEAKDQESAALLQSLKERKEAAGQAGARLSEVETTLKRLQDETQAQAESLLLMQAEKQRLETALDDGRKQIRKLEDRQAEDKVAGHHSEDELSGLRVELEELAAAKMAAEEALSRAGRRAASDAKGNVDVRVLQAELTTLNGALDEADHSYEQLQKEKLALEEALIRQQAQASESGAEALVQQHEAEMAALRSELELVRQQAEVGANKLRAAPEATEQNDEQLKLSADSGIITALQKELEEARLLIKEKELSSSADAAECEVLRQDIDKLRRSLDERSAELERTRKEGLLLEEKTEERNSEIDRLKLALEAAQVDADEAQFKRDEAFETRKQVEDALYKLQQQIERERPRDDLLDKRLASTAVSYDVAAISSGKRTVAGLLAGAVLAFAGAEAFSILGGKGEIISGYLDGDNAAVSVESPIPVVEAPLPRQAEVPPVVEIAKQPEPLPEIKKPVTAAAPMALLVTAPTPPEVVKRAPPKVSEPETGSRIQDRLAAGGSGSEMRYVRGGTFAMGSRVNNLASEEQPVHEVRLPSFSIGQHEVTFREYEVFAAATGLPLPDDLGWGRGARPVINVSWDDARAYTVWLSEQTGYNYRLPTEAEWEYAAAAGTDTPYWWGFDLDSGRANCFNCGSQWDGLSTAPVGRFQANPYGLHNTAGNVMEWVDDCYHPSYAGAPADGSSWQATGCTERVIRGGAFNKPGESLRVTKRGRHDANAKLFVLGFRVARDVR